jgi:GH15 family glucan-1,4-alpha-glucosidase
VTGSERTDGFAPIEDYAVLGDGRTVALLASDGSVDWWPLPALDSPPVLSRLLDPDGGGRLILPPADAYEATRCYLDDTNVVESVYTGLRRDTCKTGHFPSAALDAQK